MAHMYNDPANLDGKGVKKSTIGDQLILEKIQKRALIDVVKEQYISPMADVTAMPKHYGKTIKQYHYLPLLDDRNVNDQGIDANGVTIADGNIYGSAKDVGKITEKLPWLTENGGRRNRVGYTRITLQASLKKLGFFDEYTKESMMFDTDEELEMHITRERLRGASEIVEDVLLCDLLHGAGVEYFTGKASKNDQITAEGSNPSKLTYEDLMKLSITLDNNRTPKYTKIISGSRMVDTKTIDSARVLFIGSELLPTFKKMTDFFNERAFVPVNQYAAGGNVLRGEVGAVDQWRIVVVPEMVHWAGKGAKVGTNPGYRATGGNYDIFPALCIGAGSFTTIGFQTGGKSVKFDLIHKAPGRETADRTDPYGETGFTSIKWFYATMILRPERLAVMKCVAEQ